MWVGTAMHGWLFKNIYVIKLELLAILTTDPLKHYNPKKHFFK